MGAQLTQEYMMCCLFSRTAKLKVESADPRERRLIFELDDSLTSALLPPPLLHNPSPPNSGMRIVETATLTAHSTPSAAANTATAVAALWNAEKLILPSCEAETAFQLSEVAPRLESFASVNVAPSPCLIIALLFPFILIWPFPLGRFHCHLASEC